jgi:hypothetical protein
MNPSRAVEESSEGLQTTGRGGGGEWRDLASCLLARRLHASLLEDGRLDR